MLTDYIKTFESFSDVLSIIKKVESDYFTSPVVNISPKARNGYSVNQESKIVTFGCNLAGDISVQYLFHEMGHFVTIKKIEKLLQHSYGLSYPKVEVLGNLYDQPVKWTAIQNELKAVVYQVILAGKYGVDPEIDGWIRSLRYMDDFLNVPAFNAPRNKDFECIDNETGLKLDLREIDRRRIITMRNFFDQEKIKPEYTLENFDKEWFNRVKYLEDNL